MSTSRPITNEEHRLIMQTMSETHVGIRPNPEIIHILTIECSTGLRLSDILSMKLSDIYLSDQGYRLKIVERKTKKERNVPIPLELQNYITEYAISAGCKRNERIFYIQSAPTLVQRRSTKTRPLGMAGNGTAKRLRKKR